MSSHFTQIIFDSFTDEELRVLMAVAGMGFGVTFDIYPQKCTISQLDLYQHINRTVDKRTQGPQ